jgi:DNA-3-methyladenine glycosylase
VHVVGGERRSGRIVELEAYIGEDDQASHARFGRTSRNAIMFGPAGFAYVYLVYGMYHCLNVVTEATGRPAALLIRAVEPIEGVAGMRADRAAWFERRRERRPESPATATTAPSVARLASGPGLVTLAFAIDRSHTGVDLCDPVSPLRLEAAPDDEPAPGIVATPRIGIDYAGAPWRELPWRFAVAGNPAVSGPTRRRS